MKREFILSSDGYGQVTIPTEILQSAGQFHFVEDGPKETDLEIENHILRSQLNAFFSGWRWLLEHDKQKDRASSPLREGNVYNDGYQKGIVNIVTGNKVFSIMHDYIERHRDDGIERVALFNILELAGAVQDGKKIVALSLKTIHDILCELGDHCPGHPMLTEFEKATEGKR
jgi:hypothetical protein